MVVCDQEGLGKDGTDDHPTGQSYDHLQRWQTVLPEVEGGQAYHEEEVVPEKYIAIIQ